uniref:Anaphase-promoting complex subunit 2 n=1 Tax=Mucochytrium quahogii TaxID=96639 RepID=A0A7S2SKH5_9STRA|mmetsp:Transcript_43030/g.69101  ORF Transcript_43030/g.69101 Transcript_43030/m.69101 type:complete len:797 (+) Transcript_43030:314-2704(+)
MEEHWEGAMLWLEGCVNNKDVSDDDHGRKCCREMFKHGLGQILEEWFFHTITVKKLAVNAETFQGILQTSKRKDTVEETLRESLGLADSIFRPLRRVCAMLDIISESSNKCVKHFRMVFDNAFVLGHPSTLRVFRQHVHEYLGRKFRQHYRLWKAKKREEADPEDEEDMVLDQLSSEDEAMVDDSESYPFEEFSKNIAELEWITLLEEPLSDILCQETEKHILKVCKGQYETHLLEHVLNWLNGVALSWLRDVLSACTVSRKGHRSVRLTGTLLAEKFAQWKTRLEFHVFETLCELRMSELFDVITEFPESSPALGDLKDCLARTHQYRDLVLSLRHAFATRLLHPGANTAQILDVYISTIKALRLLDPSGVLLEAISEPIKCYLRKREDTVRCIVTSLTDDSNSELFEELGKGDGMKPIAHNYEEGDDEGDYDELAEAGNFEDWIPDPIEADPCKNSRSRKTGDILSMLVHIYGTKELFVNEYRMMLADKLLSSLDFDADREVRNLELLKLRFGESSMLNCEIMVKDIEDSKRINKSIKTTLQNKRSTSARVGSNAVEIDSIEVTIVSKQFWPTLHGEDIEPHPDIKKKMSAISHEYSVLKNPRQLVWKSNLGIVQLELEFDEGQKKTFTVNPMLASLVMHVAERESWNAPDLAAAANISEATLKKRISYWINQGVIRTSKEYGVVSYFAVDKLSDDHKHQTSGGAQDEDATERAVSADAQLEAEMKVYESFVRGMLNNYESLPLDRIHNMLKMFVSTGEHKYDKNVQQLGAFLDKLVRDDVLEFSNAGYFLKKS